MEARGKGREEKRKKGVVSGRVTKTRHTNRNKTGGVS